MCSFQAEKQAYHIVMGLSSGVRLQEIPSLHNKNFPLAKEGISARVKGRRQPWKISHFCWSGPLWSLSINGQMPEAGKRANLPRWSGRRLPPRQRRQNGRPCAERRRHGQTAGRTCFRCGAHGGNPGGGFDVPSCRGQGKCQAAGFITYRFGRRRLRPCVAVRPQRCGVPCGKSGYAGV